MTCLTRKVDHLKQSLQEQVLSGLPLKQRGKIYQSCVRPVLSHRSEIGNFYCRWVKFACGLWFSLQKIKFSIKDFFSRCDQIRWKLRIWSHLLQQSLMEKFHFLCRGWDDVWDKKKLKKFQIMLSEKKVGAAVTIENNLEQSPLQWYDNDIRQHTNS